MGAGGTDRGQERRGWSRHGLVHPSTSVTSSFISDGASFFSSRTSKTLRVVPHSRKRCNAAPYVSHPFCSQTYAESARESALAGHDLGHGQRWVEPRPRLLTSVSWSCLTLHRSSNPKSAAAPKTAPPLKTAVPRSGGAREQDSTFGGCSDLGSLATQIIQHIHVQLEVLVHLVPVLYHLHPGQARQGWSIMQPR
jgi:hypothetical protein